VLLCKRNIEPRKGLWTLPAGFMELGETSAAGALRETVEEAGANVALQGLFTLMNVVMAGQVHFFYRAQMLDAHLDPGPETQEARLFSEADIPWDQIAFRTVKETLRLYFADRRAGEFSVHCTDIV
jgi:ADP-ribose pyrophosphatase YjhB (NUDIX family)